ncbi:hypothetical protein FRB90_005597 [Tulasnella sp. 427]|nr:hypothetical protein FRB90_005597 [Tulasnella sp. 427]
MRFSVGSALLAGATLAAASDVLDLIQDNFESTIAKEPLVLVEFFAPWCGHCKSLAPEYEQAATALKEKNVPIAKVDCVDQADLCSAQGVTGYPTLKVFRNGEASTYGGPRKADGIIAYMLKQSLPPVSDVTGANHEEFKSSDKVVVVAYVKDKSDALASTFAQVAEKHRDDYLFGLSTDEHAAKIAGVTAPAVVVYQKFDQGRADFPSTGIEKTNSEVLEKFILDNSVALLDQVTGENYPAYAQTGLPLAYMFIDPYDEKLQEHIDAVKPIAAKHKGKINFVWIDAIKYADHAKTLNLKMDNWPGFVIQDIEGGLKFPMSGVVPSFATVDDWVSKFAAGTLEPSLKTQEVPKENDGPVKVVVNSEYNKLVLDDSKDVFVEFYAPWCGHCKRLAPTWEELGEHYADVKDKITIAKMDAIENDLPPNAPFKIAGFPTLMFKPAGSSEFLQYDGDRTLEDLIKFTGQHAKNDVTPPPKAATTESAAEATESPEAAKHEELKQNLQPILPSLSAILLSDKSDDAISEEVLELLGFDEMDLVADVLGNRKAVGREASQLMRVEYRSRVVGSDDAVQLAGPTDAPAPPSQKSEPTQRSSDALLEGGFGKKGKKGKHKHVVDHAAEAKQRLQDQLAANAAKPLFSGTAGPEAEVYPHVYTSSSHQSVTSSFGSKFILPLGTTRQTDELCEEVVIPPSRPIPPKIDERLIPVSELEPLPRNSFPGYTTLNRMQSIIFPTVYGTNENLLICAPTGAGKTDIAMLSILRVLDQHRTHPEGRVTNLGSTINRDEFKIIYVAPMKALASEIVRKLGKRLAWLSILVRELTGDMQMTRAEIAETQIIVTTPEKWDVVTRKPTGEGELASKVKLLIIDEVHLLNEERGAVIETIVARTLRQVESSQSVIRIVGLSATLPNYIDVADFLRVNRYTGLFYFDQSFRPVPLEQHFIGVRGKLNSPQQKKNLDRIVYEKVLELVQEGHQVMVFVHARKETVKSALALSETILLEGVADDFDPTGHPQWDGFRREISASRNKEMKELFDQGFGIHHAGMLRADRNMMERMFEARAIKVLFCTATLAWGVNLPAHAVLIKGTDVYDSGRGQFVDLSVLDVLQIFGRAGRPGLESSGVGYICTPNDKLDHYLNAVTSQHPIESKFMVGLIDSLNAEISLGTVSTVNEAVEWLGYTYLFVRMRKNPLVYGIPRDELSNDPQLRNRREEWVVTAAKRLAVANMIQFDPINGHLNITELGNIAAKYYIRLASIEIFNQEFRSNMAEADVLVLLSKSTEFNQIQVRENEIDELQSLENDAVCEVRKPDEDRSMKVKTSGPADENDEPGKKTLMYTSHDKVNILLQAYISRGYVEDFALVSDSAYVAQNAGRIIRALLEIALSRKWAKSTAVLMAMSKAVEKRMWPFDHPLTQSGLSRDLMYNLQQWADELSVHDLASQSAAELGKLVHLNERQGKALLRAAQEFPTARITYSLRPETPDLLKISIKVEPAFKWSEKVHGSIERFWMWVEDADGVYILQWAQLVFRQTTKAIETDFVVPMSASSLPSHLSLRLISDRWIGAEEEVSVPLTSLKMPKPFLNHSSLLNIPWLGTQVFQKHSLVQAYERRISKLNTLQSQCFFTFYNTAQNVLVASPSASGKSFLGQTAAWRAMASGNGQLALVINSRKSSMQDLSAGLRSLRVGETTIEACTTVDELRKPVRASSVRITTASCVLVLVTEFISDSFLGKLSLVVCEDLTEMDDEYELAISLLRCLGQKHPIRFIGLSMSLDNPSDLGDWLGVPETALFSFQPSEREQLITTTTHTSSIPHSAAFFKTNTKVVYSAIRAMPNDQSIVFVPSRSICTRLAADITTQCAMDLATTGLLKGDVDPERLEYALAQLGDRSLVEPVRNGIGIYHRGIPQGDQRVILELFAEGILRAMIMPREQCWTTPLRAGLVITLGTQWLRFEPDGDRQIVNYSINEILRMQRLAVRHLLAGRYLLICHPEERDTFRKFLDHGLPLESQLMESVALRRWVEDGVQKGKIKSPQDVIDFLSFTFLARRVKSNPTYYDAESGQVDEVLSRFVDRLWPVPEDAGASSSALQGGQQTPSSIH